MVTIVKPNQYKQRTELSCPCGATIVLENAAGSFINTGGAPDNKGRKYIIQVDADKWLDRHQSCITTKKGTP